MKHAHFFHWSAALAALVAAGCASTVPEAPLANVPARLQPAGETLSQVVPAKGVQIYECRAKAGAAGQAEWAFVAPEAELFDRRGAPIGKHYGGPHWEALDGSKVVGAVRERADAPQAGAIPWLLLGARSAGPEGSFSKVTSIQRVNTVGGLAPRDGCASATLGRTARVAYTADYYFFTR
jgi:hypothetical protein